jgi:DNA-binding NarL/FixJ family response regulator
MRVLIADDHAPFRDGLRSLLEAWEIDVVGEAADGEEAVRRCRELQPDLVLMDLSMPKLDGLAATRRLTAELPAVKVVVLTVSEEEADLFAAIAAGAKGYLVKDLAAEEFVHALERVSRGEPALAPVLGRRLLERFDGRSRRQANGH